MSETFRRESDAKISNIDNKIDVLSNSFSVHQKYNEEKMSKMMDMFESFCDKFDHQQAQVISLIKTQETQNGQLISVITRVSDQDERITNLENQVLRNTEYRNNISSIVWKVIGGMCLAVGVGLISTKYAKASELFTPPKVEAYLLRILLCMLGSFFWVLVS